MKYLEFITAPENVPDPNGGWVAYPSQIIIDDHPFLQSAQEVMLLQYSAKIYEQAATIARLTSAHEMQGEELVTLPRHMVIGLEDKLKAQAAEIAQLTEKVRYAYVQIEALEGKK